jgi:hypothetical protein
MSVQRLVAAIEDAGLACVGQLTTLEVELRHLSPEQGADDHPRKRFLSEDIADLNVVRDALLKALDAARLVRDRRGP